MRQLSLMLVLVMSLVGCGDKWDKATSKMEDFKTKMCACKDKACVDDVNKEETAWEKSMKDSFKKDEKPPEKSMTKAAAIAQESSACRKSIEKVAGAAATADSLKKMTAFKDSMCACKDAACANKVSEDMATWSKEQAASPDPAPVMDEVTTKQFTDLSTAMATCMQTAMTGSAAAPAPAAP